MYGVYGLPLPDPAFPSLVDLTFPCSKPSAISMPRLSFHNVTFAHTMFLGKRHINSIYIIFILLFVVLTLRSLWPGPRIVWTDPPPASGLESSPPSPLELPGDYKHVEEQPPLCAQRLGLVYLEELRHSRATYCSEQSKSQLTCFHSPN